MEVREMRRKQFTPEKVIGLLRQAEVGTRAGQARRRGLTHLGHLGAKLLSLAQ
jgi:hypothetical protein